MTGNQLWLLLTSTSVVATKIMMAACRWMSSPMMSTKPYGSPLTITPEQQTVNYARINSLPPIFMVTFTKLAVTPRATFETLL